MAGTGGNCGGKLVMELIRKTLINYHQLPPSKVESMLAFFDIKTFSKGEYFLRQGDICRHIAFIEKGSMVYFAHNEADESACDLALEGEWVTYVKSLSDGTPAEISIRTVEPVQAVVLSLDNLSSMVKKHPDAAKVQYKLIQDGMVAMARRSVEMVSLSVENRYQKLLSDKPEIFKRFPVTYIASYLGITPRHLNRLRGGK
ncbi:MAG: Crp/Fnr family transcriptional regulator [Bacteroidetes bacterium]|nr:Crp/Fnr family transcriptional regulator [Bacteroidota bacterium]